MSDSVSAVPGVGVALSGATTSPAAAGREAERLRQTAQEVEGVFLGVLMKAMRSTVGNGGLFQKGPDAQMYREFFDEEVGRVLARGGGVGLAQMVLRALDGQTGAAGEYPGSNAAQVLAPKDRYPE